MTASVFNSLFVNNQSTWLRPLALAPNYFGAWIDLIMVRDLYSSSLVGDEPEPLEFKRRRRIVIKARFY